jgi:uncharacterized RDD family membrane protein YckC
MEAAFERGGPTPAGFWIRFVAFVIDMLLVLAGQFLFGVLAGLIWGADLIESSLFHGIASLFTFVLGGAYSIVLHAHDGQTLGKMLVHVRVEQVSGRPLSKGRAFVRWLAGLVSAMPLLLGFVLAGLRRDKRGLHDLLAGTRVVRTA